MGWCRLAIPLNAVALSLAALWASPPVRTASSHPTTGVSRSNTGTREIDGDPSFDVGAAFDRGGSPGLAIGQWDGITAMAALESPYEDPLQQQIPFGQRSYYLVPWRAYMDTWPAARFLDCLGINFNVDERQAEATAQVLAEAGFRSARVEIGWETFSYDDPSQPRDNKAWEWTTKLQALRRHGIRPLILLNAHSGLPSPFRNLRVRLLQPVPAGSRELTVDRTAEIRPAYTGLTGMAAYNAFPLITRVDPETGRCDLSAPCPKSLPAGPLDLMTLRYQPFAGPVFADGRPNPASQETLAGWMQYVAAVAQLARTALGTEGAADAGFDLEVWNEYSFGSQFLDERNYYDPPRAFQQPLSYSGRGGTRLGIEILLPMTVDYVNDPAHRLPGVHVISGFSSQRPWDSGTDMWPGQAGFSRHYYTGIETADPFDGICGFLSPITESRPNEGPLNALGKPDGVPDGQDWHTVLPGTFFIPTLTISMPEAWQFGYKIEYLTRDLQPFPGPWVTHHRYSHAPNGQPAQVWMTEFNLDRGPWAEAVAQQAACPRDDPRFLALLQHVASKGLLRSFVFHSHKGVQTISAFAAREADLSLGTLPEAFFRSLEAANGTLTGTVRAQIGPQIQAIQRVANLMRSGTPLETARPLAVSRLVEYKPRLVFLGDGTPAHPHRWNRDDFACLPFQLDAGRFAVGYYVATRNIVHPWSPTLGLLDPARYDMPEQTFDLTLENVRGEGAAVTVWDPATDQAQPAVVIASGHTSLTVRLPTTDCPRFLIIQESAPGPLILSPRLQVDAFGSWELTFATNLVTRPRISWGPIPDRLAAGSTTLPAGTSHRFTLPFLNPSDGVRITVEQDGLTTRWPRWGLQYGWHAMRQGECD